MNSPDKQAKIARTYDLINEDFGLRKDDIATTESLNIFDKSKKGLSKSQEFASHIGRHADSRIKKRYAKHTSSIGMYKYEQSLSPIHHHIYSVLNSSGGTNVLIGSVGGEPVMAWDERIPNARLGSETPVNNTTGMLGSSQLSVGCQGDFCEINLPTLEVKGSLEGTSDTSGLSAWRQKILTQSQSDGLIDPKSKLSKIMKGNPVDYSPNEKNALPHSIVAVDENQKLRQIALKSIIQARQEMPLVKLQLERHRRNQKGDYLREDSFREFATAGKVPAHYYSDVPCCLNCYKVYNIVDKARDKSIKKITKERQKKEDEHLRRTRYDTVSLYLLLYCQLLTSRICLSLPPSPRFIPLPLPVSSPTQSDRPIAQPRLQLISVAESSDEAKRAEEQGPTSPSQCWKLRWQYE